MTEQELTGMSQEREACEMESGVILGLEGAGTGPTTLSWMEMCA